MATFAAEPGVLHGFTGQGHRFARRDPLVADIATPFLGEVGMQRSPPSAAQERLVASLR